MASYTIEDIELIRRKSGISYQEAVALLDYHNGNVARALIDLERNGRILSDEEQAKRAAAQKQTEAAAKPGKRGNSLFQRLYRKRLKVRKGDVMIANISLLFCIAAVLFSPHMAIATLIISLILGYKLNVDHNDPDFAGENLDQLVRSAADNVKSSVEDLARGFADSMANSDKKQAAKQDEPKTESAERSSGSYYQSNPAAASTHGAYSGGPIPTIQVPVKVESTDGDVTVEQESDGHHSATIG